MSKDLRKTVELATKPKRAAPKAKYIDPIVQSTFNQDGALQEIIKTLSLRLRDPNTTVAFKSLITLHTIMRSGSLTPVYSYLSTSSLALTLSSHEAPNISAYGHYLSARIKSYTNLKRDVIRDKSDRRNKDRLRKLGVEQGLLRETREVQRMIAACVESKFYTDDVDDDVSMTALRLLTKDLLILFTCVNEGMINILEHYFEMSHSDATTALKIYKTFCRDTEKVVAYLGIAKKLYNVLNVPIPNLKHAPVSLAGSLEEYLNDPNFEKNRQEYKENKRVADGGKPVTPQPTSNPPASTSTSTSSAAPTSSTSTNTAPSTSTSQPPAKSFTDFFESIEQSQTSMFPGSPSMNGTLSSQMTGNPFGMMGGGGGGFGAFPGGIQPQFTGFQPPQMQQQPNPFLQPQFTGFIPPPQQQQQQQQPFMQPHFTGFNQSQPQMMQPQLTGYNPFRQSMMPTGGGGGGSPFGALGGGGGGMQQSQMNGNPFPPQQQQQPFLQPQSTGFSQSQPPQQRPMSMLQPQSTGNPFLSSQQAPSRQSTLSPSFSSPSLPTIPQSSSSSTPAPLVAQKTGARNPFAPAPGTLIPQTQEPEPRGPSMNELAFTSYQSQSQPQIAQQNGSGQNGQPAGGGGGNQQQQEPKKPLDAFSRFLEQQKTGTTQPQPLTAQKTGGLFASIASDFTMNRPSPSSQPEQQSSLSFPPPTSSSFSTTPSYLSSQPTGTTNSFATQNGRKAFQPTSSFGSNLFNEFSSSSSPSSSSTPTTSAFNPSNSTHTFSPSTAINGNGERTTSPQPLQPQSTGYNPFAGSKLPPLNSSLGGANGSAFGAFGGSGAGSDGGANGVTTGSLI